MTKESIWSSAAYAGVGANTAHASAVSNISRNATMIRANRPPTCQARSPADARNCTISSLSPIARGQGPFGLSPRLAGGNGWRLSYSRLPVARAISTLAYPSGEVERQRDQCGARALASSRSILAISRRVNNSLRVRRASWLVQVPWLYSGMCAARSQTSPSSTVAKASVRLARPSRNDFTSVPLSTIPAS